MAQTTARRLPSSFVAHVRPLVRYELLATLQPEPAQQQQLREDFGGSDEAGREAAARFNARCGPREVSSGHYVLVTPKPLPRPRYVAHSASTLRDVFFGALPDDVVHDDAFVRFFSGDLAGAVAAAEIGSGNDDSASGINKSDTVLRRYGWSTGYALSIMGQEYYHQCPFRTGNGYGDGRAISILEVANPAAAGAAPNAFEFQLKGAGPTPYCRGADGRAVLRSSIREFVASEFMHAAGIPTTRPLVLVVSESETVKRPWYSEGSERREPDRLVTESVAISTRVAPSMLRVGQLELFGRRARRAEHPDALRELQQIVSFAMQREYPELGAVPDAAVLPPTHAYLQHVCRFAAAFRERLIDLVVGWVRVGFCQGNFNADNTSVGGRTLDYGPFGFVEPFDPMFQPWTGGGQHYSLIGQLTAAGANFKMLCVAVAPLFRLATHGKQQPANDGGDAEDEELDDSAAISPQFAALTALVETYAAEANAALQRMWTQKLGMSAPAPPQQLVEGLWELLEEHPTDYTIFFRLLSECVPSEVEALRPAFYPASLEDEPKGGGEDKKMDGEFEAGVTAWLRDWRQALARDHGWADAADPSAAERAAVSERMRRVNPKYVPRERLLVHAYHAAAAEPRDFSVLHELLDVLRDPYDIAACSSSSPTATASVRAPAEDAGGDATTRTSASEGVTAAAATGRYFRRAATCDLRRGGIAVMT